MDWDCMDLGSVMEKKNKNKGTLSKQVIIKSKSSGPVRIKNDILLKLTKEIDFSMTKFEKPSKGFTNLVKVNCFMNVCLQSLFACPAFFNMMIAFVNNPELEATLDSEGLLSKLVKVSRYFEPTN